MLKSTPAKQITKFVFTCRLSSFSELDILKHTNIFLHHCLKQFKTFPLIPYSKKLKHSLFQNYPEKLRHGSVIFQHLPLFYYL